MTDLKPTSESERAEWRQKHRPVDAAWPDKNGPFVICDWCRAGGGEYPCPTARLLADLELAERNADLRKGARDAWATRTEQAERERDAAREVLRLVEWGTEDAGRYEDACPLCGASREVDFGEHAPSCRLAGALSREDR